MLSFQLLFVTVWGVLEAQDKSPHRIYSDGVKDVGLTCFLIPYFQINTSPYIN